MALINKDGFYSISTFPHHEKLEFLNESLVHRMRDMNTDEYEFYYLEFKLKDSFDVYPLHTFVDENILRRIKNKEIFLMLVNFHEGYMSIVEGIYKSLIMRDQIPAEQIILCSGNYDILGEVQRLSKETGYPEIRVEWYLELEYAQRERKLIMLGENPHVKPSQPSVLDTLQYKKYDKKYLNFNRRWRIHRPIMVALLKCHGLLDKGYVSLGDSDMSETWADSWWRMIDEVKMHPVVYDMFVKNKDYILDTPKLYIDTTDLVTNRAWHDTDTDYLYNDTYFSLVSETMYYQARYHDSGRYLTEKVFKPITSEHPFLLITYPKTLPLLTQLGYKTYSPYINEDYDDEMDDYERMLTICKEVKRLCELDDGQLGVYLRGCKDIARHNLDTLMNKKNFVYKMNYK